jgi:hypothetical protein
MAFFVGKKMHKMHRSKIPWMIPNSRKWGPLATANGSCILLCPVTWDPKSASACFQVTKFQNPLKFWGMSSFVRICCTLRS